MLTYEQHEKRHLDVKCLVVTVKVTVHYMAREAILPEDSGKGVWGVRENGKATKSDHVSDRKRPKATRKRPKATSR